MPSLEASLLLRIEVKIWAGIMRGHPNLNLLTHRFLIKILLLLTAHWTENGTFWINPERNKLISQSDRWIICFDKWLFHFSSKNIQITPCLQPFQPDDLLLFFVSNNSAKYISVLDFCSEKTWHHFGLWEVFLVGHYIPARMGQTDLLRQKIWIEVQQLHISTTTTHNQLTCWFTLSGMTSLLKPCLC